MEILFVLMIAIFLVIVTFLFAVMAVAINQQKHTLRNYGQDRESYPVDMRTQ
jgi:hypothetical protein